MSLTPISLEEIQTRFTQLAQQLGTPPTFPFSTAPTGNGTPHVELKGQTYAYVVTDRGTEVKRRETRDADELLYWLLSDVTWDLASAYASRRRVRGEDFRRQLFGKHIELLTRLRPDWAARKQVEYGQILEKHPFHDDT